MFRSSLQTTLLKSHPLVYIPLCSNLTFRSRERGSVIDRSDPGFRNPNHQVLANGALVCDSGTQHSSTPKRAHTDTDINLHQGHQYSPYRKECSPCRPQVLILLTRLERFLSLVVPAYIPTACTSPPFPSESSPRDRSNGVRDNTAAPLPSSPPPFRNPNCPISGLSGLIKRASVSLARVKGIQALSTHVC